MVSPRPVSVCFTSDPSGVGGSDVNRTWCDLIPRSPRSEATRIAMGHPSSAATASPPGHHCIAACATPRDGRAGTKKHPNPLSCCQSAPNSSHGGILGEISPRMPPWLGFGRGLRPSSRFWPRDTRGASRGPRAPRGCCGRWMVEMWRRCEASASERGVFPRPYVHCCTGCLSRNFLLTFQ